MQLVPALRGFKEIAAQIAAAGAMISTSTGDPVSFAVFNFKSCFSGDPLIYKYKAADSLQNSLIFPAESPVIMMCSFQLWIHQIGLSAPSINTLHYTIYNYLHRCHDSHLGLSKNEISCSDQQPAIFLSPSPLSLAPTLALQFSISHFRVAQWGAPL